MTPPVRAFLEQTLLPAFAAHCRTSDVVMSRSEKITCLCQTALMNRYEGARPYVLEYADKLDRQADALEAGS